MLNDTIGMQAAKSRPQIILQDKKTQFLQQTNCKEKKEN